MIVRFIDTSILTNLLNVPGKNQDIEKVKEEFKRALDNKDTLILPMASIIETGNHIAHIKASGSIRRKCAERFCIYLNKTAKGEAPWTFDGIPFSKTDLEYLAGAFPDWASRRTGLGDLSIIRQYENYIENVPATGKIIIWSMDTHLAGYCRESEMILRRKSK
jgi:hypoxanthine-guanine phosphoribosyltransferase